MMSSASGPSSTPRSPESSWWCTTAAAWYARGDGPPASDAPAAPRTRTRRQWTQSPVRQPSARWRSHRSASRRERSGITARPPKSSAYVGAESPSAEPPRCTPPPRSSALGRPAPPIERVSVGERPTASFARTSVWPERANGHGATSSALDVAFGARVNGPRCDHSCESSERDQSSETVEAAVASAARAGVRKLSRPSTTSYLSPPNTSTAPSREPTAACAWRGRKGTVAVGAGCAQNGRVIEGGGSTAATRRSDTPSHPSSDT